MLELLVSIAVIFVLAGIMLPALHNATSVVAPLFQCQSNLDAVKKALPLYYNDHNAMLPFADYSMRGLNGGPSLQEALEPYGLGEMSAWICPADRRDETFVETSGSYVYPPGVAMRHQMPVRLIDLPQQFPIVADRRAFHSPYAEDAMHSMVPTHRNRSGSRNSGANLLGMFRLPEGCNALFRSGNVSHMGFEPVGSGVRPSHYRRSQP